MHLRIKALSVSCALALLSACGGVEEELPELAQRKDAIKASRVTEDNGTSLSATAAVTANTCTSEEEAQVDLAGTVTSTGSVDSVIITASIDGGAPVQMGTLQPQDFSHDGRIKTASGPGWLHPLGGHEPRG
jgi:hypothetical protein